MKDCRHDRNNCNGCGDCGCQDPCYKPIPCAPIPCGLSTEEQIQNLNAKTNALTHEVNKVLEKGCGTLAKIENVACANGAFYSNETISVQQGYSADDSTTYSITTVNPVDRGCKPVKFKLGTAYADTTNSGVKESLFTCGELQLANIAFTAIEAEKLYGHTIVRGIPLPTEKDNDSFCYGFTNRGVLKAYSSSISKDQFQRDNIRDLIGCRGIIIDNGVGVSGAYTENIKDANTKSAKSFIGQNYETGQTFILECGNYSETESGMTVTTATNILLQYGCNCAVYIAGENSDLLDKGGSVITPHENRVPDVLAYWYVTKKKCFSNDYQIELAQLTYKTQMALSKIYLLEKADDHIKELIKDIQNQIDDINVIVLDHEERITALEKCCEEVQKILDEINEKLDKEIDERIAEDARLEALIKAEEQAREEAIADLENQINGTASTLKALKDALELETKERKEADVHLQDLIDDTIAKTTSLKNSFDAYVIQNDIDIKYLKDKCVEIEANMQAFLAQLASLQAQLAKFDEWVIQVNETVANFETVLMSLKELVNAIDVRLKYVESHYVQTVSGDLVDNSDPQNPRINTTKIPLNYVESVTGNVVDNTNKKHPVVTAVKSIKGTGVDNTDPENPVINIPDVPELPDTFVESVTGTAVTGTAKNPVINKQEFEGVESVTGTAVTGTAKNPIIDMPVIPEIPETIVESVTGTYAGGTPTNPVISGSLKYYSHGGEWVDVKYPDWNKDSEQSMLYLANRGGDMLSIRLTLAFADTGVEFYTSYTEPKDLTIVYEPSVHKLLEVNGQQFQGLGYTHILSEDGEKHLVVCECTGNVIRIPVSELQKYGTWKPERKSFKLTRLVVIGNGVAKYTESGESKTNGSIT